MADKRESTPKPEIRTVPGDIYKLGVRAADSISKWNDNRKKKPARTTNKRSS
jgi:hypothetical protein